MVLIIGYHARKGSSQTYAGACTHAHSVVAEHAAPGTIPCVAMFASGPRNSHLNIASAQLEALKTYAARSRVRFLFHASYVDLPWGSDTGIFERARHMLRSCEEIGGADVVMHASKSFFDTSKSEHVFAAIARIWREEKFATARLFIETMPSIPQFAEPREINTIFDIARRYDLLQHVGLCIDTAHIWAAGADISTHAECEEWLSDLDDDIICALHLNDSKEPIGTHRDIHTTLGNGEIWAREDAYMTFVNWARERSVPIILERNDDPEREAIADMTIITRKERA